MRFIIETEEDYQFFVKQLPVKCRKNFKNDIPESYPVIGSFRQDGKNIIVRMLYEDMNEPYDDLTVRDCIYDHRFQQEVIKAE